MTSDDELKRLLQRAADLVKDLPAGLQGEAFNRAFETLSGTSSAPGEESGEAEKKQKKRSRRANQGGASSPRRTRDRTSPTRLKDLNLRPKGVQSFEDFVAEKQPRSDHERKLLAVYYLTRILELEGVSLDHVYSCFKDQNWKVPSDLAAGLRLTASKKAWIDTSNISSLTVAIPGENFVEHDMPKRIERDEN